MWERRISHSGLKAFRVVRGGDASTVDLIAKLQLDRWEERWQKIQVAAAKRKREEDVAKVSFQKKELAPERTREAERQQGALIRLLRDGIEVDCASDWEQLKDRTPFPEPKPDGPEPLPGPPPLQRGSPLSLPNLTLLDQLLPRRRSRRVVEAERRYSNAHAQWMVEDQQVREANARNQSEYEKRMKDWLSRRATHATALAGQHSEVESRKLAYEARQPEDLIEYWSHVLLRSEYPEGFCSSTSRTNASSRRTTSPINLTTRSILPPWIGSTSKT